MPSRVNPGLEDHMMVVKRDQGVSKYYKRFDVPFSHVYLIERNELKQFRQFTDSQKIQDAQS